MLWDTVQDECSPLIPFSPPLYAITNTVFPLVLSGETELVILPREALERERLSSIKVSGLNCLCLGVGEQTPFWASYPLLPLLLPEQCCPLKFNLY